MSRAPETSHARKTAKVGESKTKNAKSSKKKLPVNQVTRTVEPEPNTHKAQTPESVAPRPQPEHNEQQTKNPTQEKPEPNARKPD